MFTQTAERRELHQVIDTLPDDGVIAMLDFSKRLRPHNGETAEWIKPIKPLGLGEMSEAEFNMKMNKAFGDAAEGKGRPAEEFFAEMEKKYSL